MDPKSGAAEAIVRAKHNLDEALARLAEIPPPDGAHLGPVIHVLGNYLFVVAALTHALERTLAGTADADVLDRLADLDHTTSLMKNALKHLVLPVGEDRASLIFLPIDLIELAAAGCDEYEPIAAKKHITMKRELPNARVTVWTDRIVLGVILENIFSNAVKYSAIEGAIAVRVSQSDSEGIVSVSDSGPGIRDDEASRLFVRGAKLSSRPTAGESFRGYGLAIAKELTDALGGRIWWENNRQAAGATFSVAVPLYDPARHQP